MMTQLKDDISKIFTSTYSLLSMLFMGLFLPKV